MIRLVVSDIDGTLLPLGKELIDERTHESIRALKDAGIGFCTASGRPPTDIGLAFGDPSIAETCVASDGMIVILNGEKLVAHSLPHDDLVKLAEFFFTYEKAGLGLCYNEHDSVTTPMSWAAIRPPEKAWEQLKKHIKYGMKIPFLDEVPKHDVYVAGVYANMNDEAEQEVADKVAELTTSLRVLKSAPGIYDLCLRTWSKAKGVQALIDALGLSMDEVAFFGDGLNDLSLFELFPNSFCSADGATASKEAARWIVPSANDYGALSVIEALTRNKGDLEATLKELGL